LSLPNDTIVTAETPEGIEIAMRPAGYAVRGAAFLIDVLIRGVILTTLSSVFGKAGHMGIGLLLIVLFVVNWLYPVIFEMLPAAATPGKQAMGLTVLMANGLPLTPEGCLIRNFLRAVDLLPLFYGFGIVAILLRRDSRRIGDLAGGTLVAYRTESKAPGAFGPGEPTQPPRALSLRQQAAITAFAWRVTRLTPERAEEIAVLAADAAPVSAAGPSMTSRLVGMARWLHGQRPAAAPGAGQVK
jgi:uncharacterized RDD family membrane protein YckC